MTLSRVYDADSDKETQPLLGDVPTELAYTAESLSSPRTKQALSAGKVFIMISFLLLGDFLANADDTFFIAIYEKVASEFASSDRAAWLILVVNLVYTVCLPIYGYLADRYNNKKIILTAYFLLVLGCGLTSVAMNFWLVILGRIVTCLGGAGLFSMTTIVIADYAEPSDVVVLRSYAVVAALLGRNAGPVIGGLLTDALGWRRAVHCELIMATFCAVVIGWLFNPEDKSAAHIEDQAARLLSKESKQLKQRKPMDVIGVLLYAVVLIALVLALKDTRSFGIVPAATVWAVVLIVFGVGLFWRERSLGEDAFIPACIFDRSLGTQYLLQLFWMLVVFTATVLIPIYFTRVENATSSSIALHFLPVPGVSMFVNLVSSRIIKTTKRYKLFIQLGVLTGSIGFFFMAFFWQGRIGLGKSLYPALLGTGAGLINASTFMAISVNSDESKKGTVVGFFFLAQELGSLIGVAGSSNLINSIFARSLLQHAPPDADRIEIISRIVRDSRFATTLRQDWQHLVVASFVKAWKVYCLVSGVTLFMVQPLAMSVVEKVIK